MARKRKQIPQMTGTQRIDLDHIQGTSDTTTNPADIQTEDKRIQSDNFEKVGPSPRKSSTSGFIKWSEISLTIKVVIWIMPVLLPLVWYASQLVFKVETNQSDIKGIKGKVEQIVEHSIKNSARIDNLEKMANHPRINFQNSESKTTKDQITPKQQKP
jgi:hypothetical protein